MASDGSGAEENTPRTPKRTPKRANSRQIVRWNDEKLAYAFAEFRLAAQRHRIDIKKALDDAAKTVAPFVTGDALIQQLAKRRSRYIRDQREAEPASATKAQTQVGKHTPRKSGTNILADLIKEEESPATPAETPAKSVKRSQRSSRPTIKLELETEDHGSDGSDSESEYTESPIKSKKKRIRAKKSNSAKKKQQDVWSDEDDEDEFVDEAGGVNTFINVPDPSPSPIDTPSKRTKSGHQKRESSFTVSNSGQVEDIYVDPYGNQTVEPKLSFHTNNASRPANSLPFYGHAVDTDNYGPVAHGYSNFAVHVAHDQLHQMSGQLQIMDRPIVNNAMALPSPGLHSSNTAHPMSLGSVLNHDDRTEVHGNVITAVNNGGDTRPSYNKSHSPGSISHSPYDAVQANPSPVHGTDHRNPQGGSFSSSDGSTVPLAHTPQFASSFHGAQGDGNFPFGHVDSSGFEHFGAFSHQGQDHFGFHHEGEDGDDDEGDDCDHAHASKQEQAAQDFHGWGF